MPLRHAVRAFLCSAIAGVLATFISHPLDTAAVYLGTGRQLPKKLSVFYRGLFTASIQGAFIYGAMLGVYETMTGYGLKVWEAALLAAFPESLLRGPFEALKNLQQTGYENGDSPGAIARAMAQGTLGTLIREIPGSLVYWFVLAAVRPYTTSSLLSGAVVGVSYALVVYPIESVRAQLVTGVRELRCTYRGSGAYIVRGLLMGALVQLFYESLVGHAPGHATPALDAEGNGPLAVRIETRVEQAWGATRRAVLREVSHVPLHRRGAIDRPSRAERLAERRRQRREAREDAEDASPGDVDEEDEEDQPEEAQAAVEVLAEAEEGGRSWEVRPKDEGVTWWQHPPTGWEWMEARAAATAPRFNVTGAASSRRRPWGNSTSPAARTANATSAARAAAQARRQQRRDARRRARKLARLQQRREVERKVSVG